MDETCQMQTLDWSRTRTRRVKMRTWWKRRRSSQRKRSRRRLRENQRRKRRRGATHLGGTSTPMQSVHEDAMKFRPCWRVSWISNDQSSQRECLRECCASVLR